MSSTMPLSAAFAGRYYRSATKNLVYRHARFDKARGTRKREEISKLDESISIFGVVGGVAAITGALAQVDTSTNCARGELFLAEPSLQDQMRTMMVNPSPFIAKSEYSLVYWTDDNIR